MLNKSILNDYKKAYLEKQALEEDIYKCFQQVVEVVFECFGHKPPAYIFFPNAREGTYGEPDLIGNNIPYEWEYNSRMDKDYILETSEFDYECEIPKEFLFIPIAEVKVKILSEIEDDKRKETAILKRKQTLSENKKKLIASAKNKLTEEELQALTHS